MDESLRLKCEAGAVRLLATFFFSFFLSLGLHPSRIAEETVRRDVFVGASIIGLTGGGGKGRNKYRAPNPNKRAKVYAGGNKGKSMLSQGMMKSLQPKQSKKTTTGRFSQKKKEEEEVDPTNNFKRGFKPKDKYRLYQDVIHTNDEKWRRKGEIAASWNENYSSKQSERPVSSWRVNRPWGDLYHLNNNADNGRRRRRTTTTKGGDSDHNDNKQKSHHPKGDEMDIHDEMQRSSRSKTSSGKKGKRTFYVDGFDGGVSFMDGYASFESDSRIPDEEKCRYLNDIDPDNQDNDSSISSEFEDCEDDEDTVDSKELERVAAVEQQLKEQQQVLQESSSAFNLPIPDYSRYYRDQHKIHFSTPQQHRTRNDRKNDKDKGRESRKHHRSSTSYSKSKRCDDDIDEEEDEKVNGGNKRQLPNEEQRPQERPKWGGKHHYKNNPPSPPRPPPTSFDAVIYEENETLYQRLGVHSNATEMDIKKAFRKLAIKVHPDKFLDKEKKKKATVAFKRIKYAFDNLVETTTRSIYDKYGAKGLQRHLEGDDPLQSEDGCDDEDESSSGDSSLLAQQRQRRGERRRKGKARTGRPKRIDSVYGGAFDDQIGDAGRGGNKDAFDEFTEYVAGQDSGFFSAFGRDDELFPADQRRR